MGNFDNATKNSGLHGKWLDQPAQRANSQSAQICGCDEGANHLCNYHLEARIQSMLPDGPMFGSQDQEADVNDCAAPTVWDDLPAFLEMPRAADAVDASVGIGGAPTRATTLPTGPTERKQFPVASGVLDYFPDALAVIANVSWKGSEQHNPGQPIFWDRSKSQDHADTLVRHFLERGTLDTDGLRHTAKMAWRALALLQKELEQEQK